MKRGWVRRASSALKHGIETLDVSDLQDELPLHGKLRKLARLRRVFRDRFLNQEMLSLFQKRTRDREMRIGRRGDGRGVDQLRKFLERTGRAHLVLLRNLRGRLRVGVVDCGEIGRARLVVKARVIFPDVPDPDDSDRVDFSLARAIRKGEATCRKLPVNRSRETNAN